MIAQNAKRKREILRRRRTRRSSASVGGKPYTHTMTICYIGIGSNLGDRRRSIDAAIEKIKGSGGIRLLRTSSFYETEPLGDIPQGKFVNGVIEIETDLAPRGLLGRLQEIETSLGRTRDVFHGPRTIDLDILLYGGEAVDERGLVIPHPRMHERNFVLRPLRELAPDLVHPTMHVKIRDIEEL